MILWQLVSLEIIYKADKNNLEITTEQIREQIKGQLQISDEKIDYAYKLYDFAKQNFTKEQLEKMDELFQLNEKAKDYMRQEDYDNGMGALGEVLWGMGELFGTNMPDPESIN
ncbi:hypothetical protein [Bacillus toyonensis]|uniref:hypothetical protein n=1 Tax=Bacillus toyonensis TaxID=155322 RepID=UPI002E1EFAFF|nr:hypothetical protein [Bacillus toyonensis]